MDDYFLSNEHPSEYFLFPSYNSEGNLPNLSLIYKVWGIFWEELKLKYAILVQQLNEVKEDDLLTFSFLGFNFFGIFKFDGA